MAKEHNPLPLSELALQRQRADRMKHIIAERNSLPERIGTGDVNPYDSEEAAVKVAQTRKDVKDHTSRVLEPRLSYLEEDIATLTEAYIDRAQTYLEGVDRGEKMLREMQAHVSEGNLEKDVFSHWQDQHNALVSQQENDPQLHEGIILYRQRQAEQEQQKTEAGSESATAKKEEERPMTALITFQDRDIPFYAGVGTQNYNLLHLFAEQKGENLDKRDIAPVINAENPDAVQVAAYIGGLRTMIEDNPKKPQIVQTIREKGIRSAWYRFNPDAEVTFFDEHDEGSEPDEGGDDDTGGSHDIASPQDAPSDLAGDSADHPYQSSVLNDVPFKQVLGERSQAVAVVTRTEVSVEAVNDAHTRLIKALPQNYRQALVKAFGGDIDKAGQQVRDLAVTTAEFQTGIRLVPSQEAFLNTSRVGNAERVALAAERLRSLLALDFIILRERVAKGEITETGFQNLFAKQVNLVALYVEGDSGVQGHEKLAEALEHLSDAERTILFQSMSTHMKAMMDYPDREECDEDQMAKYFSDALYGKHGLMDDDGEVKATTSANQMLDKVSMLIDTCEERMGETFQIRDVFAKLLRPPYHGATIQRIIEAAYFAERLDGLACLFEENTDTARYAQQCRDYLDGKKEMEVPRWMNKVDEQRHARED